MQPPSELDAVRSIVEEAEAAGADDTLCETILGTTMMYGEQGEEAVKVLEAAYANAPNRLATVSTDESERLLSFGAEDFPKLVLELDQIIHENPAWGVARIVRAQAPMQQTLSTHEYETAERAMEDVVVALQISLSNPYVTRVALKVATNMFFETHDDKSLMTCPTGSQSSLERGTEHSRSTWPRCRSR